MQCKLEIETQLKYLLKLPKTDVTGIAQYLLPCGVNMRYQSVVYQGD